MSNPLDLVRPLPPIDPEEEARLVRLAQEGDSLAATTLIRTQALALRRLANRAAGTVAAEDLFQVAAMALLEAIQGFDPARGIRLHRYARPLIHGAVQDATAEDSPIPVPARTRRKFAQALREAEGDLKTAKGLAVAQGMKAETWETVRHALYGAVYMDDDARLREGIPDTDEVRPAIDAETILARLPEREALVVRLAFGIGSEEGEPMTDGAIAAHLGVDRSRVVRIRNRALDRLRAAA